MSSAPKRKKAARSRKASKGKKAASKQTSSREKIQAYRRRLRAQGLRLIRIWVPDTRSNRFATQAHRQSQKVAASKHAQGDQSFIDALSEIDLE